MSQVTEPRLYGTAAQDDLTAYLLGVGRYAYRDQQWQSEQYNRVLRAIRALGHLQDDDPEAVMLRYAAQLAQVDRVLAAIFVRGALEAAAVGTNWTHISEDTLFRVALEHGRLLDYVSFSNDFAMPAGCEYADPLIRYTLFVAHFLPLPEGPARQGLRLGICSLFDRATEAVAAGLALCDRLRGQDALLDSMASDRLLLALERGEITEYGAAYHDLGAQIVAAAGRWGLVAALPHLYRILDSTTTRDRSSRVLRALLLRAIEQLS